jgi:hypothetical protein
MNKAGFQVPCFYPLFVFPNPASNYVSVHSLNKLPMHIQIINCSGVLVKANRNTIGRIPLRPE